LGWSIQDHLRADLVDQALTMAVVLRGVLPAKVVFHADRGTQYTSAQIAELCTGLGLRQSVGRTGVCLFTGKCSAAGSKNATTAAAATRHWP